MKHKKIIISLSLVFFLLILNFIINNIAANKINSEIQNQIKILENNGLPKNSIKYDDISCSVLSSSITISNLNILNNDDFYANIKKITVTADEYSILSLVEIVNSSSLETSGLKLEIIDLDADAEDLYCKLSKGLFKFSGKIGPEIFDANLLTLELTNLQLGNVEKSNNTIKTDYYYASFQLKQDGEYIDLLDLAENGPKNLISINQDFALTIKGQNIYLPRQIVREMELDEIGIKSLEVQKILYKTEKKEKEILLETNLSTKNNGTYKVESIFDFSNNEKDPYIDLEIKLENVNRMMNKLLRKTKIEKDENNIFRFEYNGRLSKIKYYL